MYNFYIFNVNLIIIMAEENFIKWFSEVGIDDVPMVGGKNAALGEMFRNLVPLGVNVPDGFALTADAYRHFFKQTGLDEQIKQILSDLIAHFYRHHEVQIKQVHFALKWKLEAIEKKKTLKKIVLK